MNTICPICLVKIKKISKVTLSCNHQMHLKCYMESLKHTTIKCPFCKKSIKENISYYKFLNNKFENLLENVKNTISIDKLLDDFK